jgi:phage tail-like protein
MRQEAIAALLPEIFRRSLQLEPSVLHALLAVMEGLHAPSEEILAQLALFFDPDQTPDRFIPFLSQWVGMDIFLQQEEGKPPAFPPGMGRLRDLILASTTLARWRGTRRGLIALLEIATGTSGFQITDGTDQPFHMIVHYPPASQAYASFIRRIVDLEKPAYVTYELVELSG